MTWLGAIGRPYNTNASSVFAPASGYGFSGTAGWDQSFTITNGTNPFGATGPTLIMFDDFRNGIAGQLMTDGASPVAGSAVWNLEGSDAPPYWAASVNRSGGTAQRLLNNETPALANNYGRRMNILLGANYTAIYLFWAENWNGWNGASNGGGGGYYKFNWLENGGFPVGAFNSFPAFIQNFVTDPVQLAIGSNDEPPLPTSWYPVTVPPGANTYLDASGWNSIETAYVGNAGNPTGADGYLYHSVFNSQKHSINSSDNTRILFNSGSGSNGSYASMNNVSWNGLMQSFNAQTIDRADVYIAAGPNCLCRFFLGDASVLANCTTIMPCTISSWAPGSVTMTLRRGAFGNSPSGNYLYWSDVNNNVSLAGQFS